MNFIIAFLGACLGLIVAVIVIIVVIYLKVTKSVGKNGMREIIKTVKNANNYELEEYTRLKEVSGITKLIEPVIITDFTDFNKELLYSKVENNLIKIFNSIEDKTIANIQNDNDLIYIIPSLKEKIYDLKNNKVNIKYDEVKFHSHAIKNYLKEKGKATITISSSLEYYFSDDSKDKKFEGIKKQTRYTIEFAYVYDETKVENSENVLAISCPNCGAPLGKLGGGNCTYCGTYVEPINLKGWYMISYKEDY